ncbi:2,3-dihydro-2,3-dihydroxybenzoate dehydrogenase [Corynebacterium phocae]|uniref:2,3-dihydro-2,3-dihydroxybenzoate dehydrogenase n=1 Tax=Corynebacterium phocae TaxID=161895 RepID=A0A1L7D5G3_9CORY|nr:SDR family oxidoreductase [Corynebacterium phocae]APT93355.1 2,3-dihydro-2,3-dihydroxybenzoate dehydrogenase [Corynebacterium phocae]KAA8721692.1 SDR family oxidoreductase [Corynebacterium phocae]
MATWDTGFRHLLITGAGGGIGKAVLDLAADSGGQVTAWDLPEVDVRDAEAVQQHLRKAVEARGPVDALIHVAGVMEPDCALEPEDNANFAVNFGGTVNVVAPVARQMCQQGSGAVVVVSSNAATTPRVGMASYGASKAAVTAWTKTLALECAPHGVRCNVVSPGSTRTPMLEGMWAPGADESAAVIAGNQDTYRLGIPLGKLAQPQDVAAACLFLISPAAGHITMHDMRVDGGATLDS